MLDSRLPLITKTKAKLVRLVWPFLRPARVSTTRLNCRILYTDLFKCWPPFNRQPSILSRLTFLTLKIHIFPVRVEVITARRPFNDKTEGAEGFRE